MACRDVGGAIVCGPSDVYEHARRPNGEPRWCFKCRAIRSCEFVLRGDREPTYYAPWPSIECVTCGTSNGDLFPGRYREWD